MAAIAERGEQLVRDDRDRLRQRAVGELRHADGSHRRRPAQPLVRRPRMGSVQDPHESRPDPAARQPGLPRRPRRSTAWSSAIASGRRACRPRPRNARRHHAARRCVEFHRTHYVPDHAAIAFAGDISLADARKLVEARLGGVEEAGAPKPSVADPAAAGPPQGLPGRAPEFGADDAVCRHAVDDAHRSRLRGR